MGKKDILFENLRNVLDIMGKIKKYNINGKRVIKSDSGKESITIVEKADGSKTYILRDKNEISYFYSKTEPLDKYRSTSKNK